MADFRRENYNSAMSSVDGAEDAVEAAERLDFRGEERVNPEDLTEGGPRMPTQAATTTDHRLPTLTPIDGLEHLFGDLASTEALALVPQGIAVRYLRVSTTRQMNTAIDIDEDGNSIATQREWTLRKNQELRVGIGPEFVEPGQSAQTISKRPVFKEMMAYVTEHHEVKYVIIYMRSRVFRNYIDAAITKRQLAERGVKLISAKEEFGDGYMGDAMEAITDVVNELQVRMSGEDIKLKMEHKVASGGSVGRAKLGYLNVRKDFDGRLVNTIDVDPVRAPFIIWAFEQYATGEYSVRQLASALEEQGLLTRASRKFRPKPISANALSVILGDPYYTGVIRYKGKLHPGRHEPLISKGLFLRVQEVLRSRNRRGDRDRVHFHYLKGLVFCADCHEAGRASRLVYSQNSGNGGTYEYFVCAAKLKGECTMPGIRAEQLERAVAKAVATEQINSDTLDFVEDGIDDVIAELQTAERTTRDALKKQLAKLTTQEARLVDALAEGDLPVPMLRERVQDLMLQKAAIHERLTRTEEILRHGADRAKAAVELIREPGALYESLPERSRRELVQALFSRLLARVTDTDTHTQIERTAGNEALHELSAHFHANSLRSPSTSKIPDTSVEDLDVEKDGVLSQVIGLNKTYLVGRTGLEPVTDGL
jgi:site-specific DNA recombinase